QPPLEQTLETFWDSGSGLDRLDLPIEPPPVSHPLLRRLGPSPFAAGGFPLVGLLATCYEQISESVLSEEEGEPEAAEKPVSEAEAERAPELDAGGEEVAPD